MNVSSLIAVNIGSNPGLAAIWEDEQQRRREAKESSQISAPSSQGQNKTSSNQFLRSNYSPKHGFGKQVKFMVFN